MKGKAIKVTYQNKHYKSIRSMSKSLNIPYVSAHRLVNKVDTSKIGGLINSL